MSLSSLSRFFHVLACVVMLSSIVTDGYGMVCDDSLNEPQLPIRRSIFTFATPEEAKAAAEDFLDEWEKTSSDLNLLHLANTCYKIAIDLCEEEGRADVLYAAASTSFKLWEADPSDNVLEATSQLFSQALEAYGEDVPGYVLQMAGGFHLRVFKKHQTEFEHLKRGTHLMLRGINTLGVDTSPTSLMIGAIYHFRLWKLDRTQTDIWGTTMDLYNRAVQAFGDNSPPKLIELKQRIQAATNS